MAALTYNPQVFAVRDERAAREIILTTEGLPTDERWRKETPYLAGLAGEHLALEPGALVVDYGCGIGRMAKAMIERFGVRVLGVDISEDMRRLAPGYVRSEFFSIVSVPVFQTMVQAGLRADAAMAIWVIQHALNPAGDLDLLKSALRPGGGFLLVNNKIRAVPTVEKAWASDGVDVKALAAERFAANAEGRLDPAHVGEVVERNCYWAAFRA